MNRRQFLKKGAIGLVSSGIAAGLYAWQIEPTWVEWTKIPMPIRFLPDHLENNSLIQISDIHIGEYVDLNFIIRTLSITTAQHPDFVVYTGDFIRLVENKVPYEALKQLLPHLTKGKKGTFAILGNHDYGYHWRESNTADEISRMLERQGVKVLRNNCIAADGLHFIGIDDYWGTNFHPEKAMSYYDASAANIVLCHNPDVCDLDVWNQYAGWILAGHTHGGQCKPPFLPAPILPVKNRNYDQGLKELPDGRLLYINRGLGHSIKVRFNVRPEVTQFTLKKQSN
ncbi:metallophosphoesterase [Sphingobacterium sp. LRF_L2]|uniref:metallophosphoesterase n=1 Tax=Sphingobacterium sp. LRF_L2 TaxID=3369421 RepID=UPI003F644F8A